MFTDYFSAPAISGSAVAFLGEYGIGANVSRGIFTGDGGPLTTVIKIGDPLFGSFVTRLGFNEFGLDPEGSGNLAFNYLLTDGRQGVAVAMIVPEPSSLVLLFIAFSVMLHWLRRRTALAI